MRHQARRTGPYTLSSWNIQRVALGDRPWQLRTYASLSGGWPYEVPTATKKQAEQPPDEPQYGWRGEQGKNKNTDAQSSASSAMAGKPLMIVATARPQRCGRLQAQVSQGRGKETKTYLGRRAAQHGQDAEAHRRDGQRGAPTVIQNIQANCEGTGTYHSRHTVGRRPRLEKKSQ